MNVTRSIRIADRDAAARNRHVDEGGSRNVEMELAARRGAPRFYEEVGRRVIYRRYSLVIWALTVLQTATTLHGVAE